MKTDGLNVYPAGLSGYHHKRFVIRDPEAVSKELPWVHTLIANAKSMIGGAHPGVSPAHLQSYLSEFCWRFSRRRFPGELFDRLVYACITGSTLTWSRLVGVS